MKVLIVRFSSIGDIVLTTPVIRCVQKQLNAEVHFLTKSSFLRILDHNPYIAKVYTVEKKIAEVLEALKAENYDCIIDLHKNLRTLDLQRKLKVKRYAFKKLNIQKWWMVNFKQNYLPEKHIVDRYLDAVQPLGVENDGQGLDFFLTTDDEVDLSSYGLEAKGFAVLVIGAAHYTKQIPTSKCVEIVNQSNKTIVLIGGKGDQEKAQEILRLSSKNVVNLVGELNLRESAYIVKQSSVVLASDTGMMHIAAAFRKKILVFWGSTIPEFGMYPYLTDYENLEVSDLSCRPCSKIGYASCPKKHFSCMEKQDLVQAVNFIDLYSV